MRKKTKFNPELLNEELKKFKLLSEYDFFHEEETTSNYEKPLILGDEQLEEADDNQEDVDATADDMANELGLGDENGEEPDNSNPEGEPAPEAEEPEMDMPEEPIEPESEDVEIDVTSLVKGSEEAKEAAEQAANQSSQNAEMLLQKLNDLEAKIASMDSVSSKIDELEKEIVKRNPTPVEKLEMRSLSSYPYSQKLTDYWADKEGAYDVMGDDKKEEYVLTQDDIDTSYSEPEIKKSFGVNPEDYEEEEI